MELHQITMRSPAVRARMKGDYPVRVPDNPLYDVLPDKSWHGQRCFILGGGTSLEGFDFERLRGERVIAINAAFRFCMSADILFFMDKANFYTHAVKGRMNEGIKKAWDEYQGYKVFLDLLQKRHIPGCYELYANTSITEGLTSSMRKGLVHGNNSGHGALNLAYCLGANPIYLLGYDFYFAGKRSHFHKAYPVSLGEASFRSFVKHFRKASEILRRTGVQVYNCNPKSRLKYFEIANIDEVLNG